MIKKVVLIAITLLFFISCKEQEKESQATFESIIKPRTLTNVQLAGGELERIDSFPSQKCWA